MKHKKQKTVQKEEAMIRFNPRISKEQKEKLSKIASKLKLESLAHANRVAIDSFKI